MTRIEYATPDSIDNHFEWMVSCGWELVTIHHTFYNHDYLLMFWKRESEEGEE